MTSTHRPTRASSSKASATTRDKTTAAPTGAATLPGATATVAGGSATGSTVGAVLNDVEVAANVVTSILGESKLSIVDDIARVAVKAAVTQLQNGVDHLKATIDGDIAASPLFAAALPKFKGIAANLGILLPSEAQIANGLKTAIADLAAAITPPAAPAPAAS